MASDQLTDLSKVERALLSVSDKSNIVPLANALNQLGIEILSTGGTAKLLQENHIPVTEVSAYTGFPEIMDGRVKTLHPKIAGGILARRDLDSQVMAKEQIKPIDLIVVNLYPFQKTIANPNHHLEDAIETIDIGGPTMIRAAAKNYQEVAVVVDVNDYDTIITELKQHSGISKETRFKLMKKAFIHTAEYDLAIANYFNQMDKEDEFPELLSMALQKKHTLRYGENPHQKAAFYLNPNEINYGVSAAKQTQGKALSFNNIVDADTAFECVQNFSETACVIVKHANPCGVAIADSNLEAYQKAFQTDATSAFGGIIAFNKLVEADLVDSILSNQFVEVIIAPEFTEDALEALAKKKNLRVLQTGYSNLPTNSLDYKRIPAGLLIQTKDTKKISQKELSVVSKRIPTDTEWLDLLFTWKVAKYVKSNAIVYGKNNMTLGIGAGQMSRIDSAKIAQIKAAEAKLELAGCVMASDAFFPFRDSIDAAHKAGVKAIIQPGGSIRDEEVIQAANESGIAMVFTGIRHFRH